jgi:prevent-host-death family protein
MKALKLAEAKSKFSAVITDVEYKQERVLIEKRDKPAAVVIGYEDYKKLETLEDIYESKLLEETIKKSRFLSLEEVAKRVPIR